MKKILLITFFAMALPLIGFSQNIGIFIGGGFSDMRFRTDSTEIDKEINKEDLRFRKIYHAGINFENTLIEKQLYLQLGIHARLSGFSGQDDSVGMYSHNIHVPIELKYKYYFDKRGESYLYVSGGPYFSLAYKGIQYDKYEQKSFLEDDGSSEMSNPVIKYGKSLEDDIQPFDYGVNIGLGYGYNYLQIGYNFGLGFANVFPSEWLTDGEKFKFLNSYHSFTIAFYFSNN
jgi:hypothetical protein